MSMHEDLAGDPSGKGGRGEALPRLAITMGDPAGVGPEVIFKAMSHAEVFELCRPVVIGDTAVMNKAAEACGGGALPAGVEMLDMKMLAPDEHQWGRISAASGRAGAAYVERAVAMARSGEVAGIVTCPLNKEGLRLAGVPYPGHTEMLGALTGTKDYAMMLVAPKMRVIHVSTHVSLEEAIRRVKTPRILTVIRMAQQTLLLEGIAQPRIAVAGLNPHAGESGLFGDQDAQDIAPAVKAAQDEGIVASGPHPPDTVFWHAQKGQFDIVVAMYHDQGHIPAKLAGFDEAVNVTVGLPIIRTSVDHGTAFDIAGQGIASERSMLAALRYAARLAS